MILLDADILLIEPRYKNDSRFPINRQILENVRSGVVRAGVTVQALLEVVGVLSFSIVRSISVEFVAKECSGTTKAQIV